MITLSVLTPMKLSALGTIQYFITGGLIERGLNKFSSPERGAYWRGGLIERGAKKRIYGMSNKQWVFMNIGIQVYINFSTFLHLKSPILIPWSSISEQSSTTSVSHECPMNA